MEDIGIYDNVPSVYRERILVVREKLPRDVRAKLGMAVKCGKLAHMKKEGLKPECYYPPRLGNYANLIRRNAERAAKSTLSAVLA